MLRTTGETSKEHTGSVTPDGTRIFEAAWHEARHILVGWRGHFVLAFVLVCIGRAAAFGQAALCSKGRLSAGGCRSQAGAL